MLTVNTIAYHIKEERGTVMYRVFFLKVWKVNMEFLLEHRNEVGV